MQATAPVLSGAIVPLFEGLLRLNTRNGPVNVLDILIPYLSGYPMLSLRRLTGKFGGQNGIILPILTNTLILSKAPQKAKNPPCGWVFCISRGLDYKPAVP